MRNESRLKGLMGGPKWFSKIIRRSCSTWNIFLRSVAFDKMFFYKHIMEATTNDHSLICILLFDPRISKCISTCISSREEPDITITYKVD